MLLISSEFCRTIFPKGVEKPHRKAGTTELCLPGWGELILQFLPAIFGTLNGFNRCFNLSRKERLEISVCTNGEVEISSLERAVSSGLERLGGPAFRDNLMEDPFMLHTGMRHVIVRIHI